MSRAPCPPPGRNWRKIRRPSECAQTGTCRPLPLCSESDRLPCPCQPNPVQCGRVEGGPGRVSMQQTERLNLLAGLASVAVATCPRRAQGSGRSPRPARCRSRPALADLLLDLLASVGRARRHPLCRQAARRRPLPSATPRSRIWWRSARRCWSRGAAGLIAWKARWARSRRAAAAGGRFRRARRHDDLGGDHAGRWCSGRGTSRARTGSRIVAADRLHTSSDLLPALGAMAALCLRPPYWRALALTPSSRWLACAVLLLGARHIGMRGLGRADGAGGRARALVGKDERIVARPPRARGAPTTCGRAPPATGCSSRCT